MLPSAIPESLPQLHGRRAPQSTLRTLQNTQAFIHLSALYTHCLPCFPRASQTVQSKAVKVDFKLKTLELHRNIQQKQAVLSLCLSGHGWN